MNPFWHGGPVFRAAVEWSLAISPARWRSQVSLRAGSLSKVSLRGPAGRPRERRRNGVGGRPATGSRPRIGSVPVAAVLFVMLVTFAVYANSFRNEFLFDDFETIVRLQAPGGPGPFGELLGLLKGRPAYRPLRSASYAFDYALAGFDPRGYHLVNTLLHALSAAVIFFIARDLFGRMAPALLTALVFAVHPIQTDAVTYLSGRRDVLSGLFVLIGFYAFLRYRRTRRAGYLALTLLAYPLGFLSKESAVVLPVLCLAYDVVSRVRDSAEGAGVSSIRALWSAFWATVRESRMIYLPFLVLAAGLAAYVLFLVRGTWVRAYPGGGLALTLLTEARVVVHYLALLIFPSTLCADYSYNAFPLTTSRTDPRALVAVLLLVALGWVLLRCLRRRPVAAFGGAWFFIALLPVSQIVPHHEMMAEHYLYVPSVGFFLIVAALAEPLLDDQRFAGPLSVAATAILLLLSLRTVWRNADWRDELTLWSKTVQVAPQAARARNNLGAAYLRRGRLDPAETQFRAALQIQPNLALAHANLGKVHLDRRELARAEEELETALRLKRDEMIPRLWLGAVYWEMGRTADAEREFRKALSRPPYDAYAYNNLGALFARSGRLSEAESAFREALRRMPDLAEARDNLARMSLPREPLGRFEAGPRKGIP